MEPGSLDHPLFWWAKPDKHTSLSARFERIYCYIWLYIDSICSYQAGEIAKAMKRGEASAEDILCYKKWRFCSEFHPTCSEVNLKSWWERFYESGHEGRFWNVVSEKRLTVEQMARSEATKRYGLMCGDAVKRRETLIRFLGIVGMNHSQEEVVLDAEKLDAMGEELCRAEKEIREGLGLRKSERKNKEWKVANTIDLIQVVLGAWGCGTVESVMTRPRIDGKKVRRYILNINKSNTIWESITGSTIDYDENLLKF